MSTPYTVATTTGPLSSPPMARAHIGGRGLVYQLEPTHPGLEGPIWRQAAGGWRNPCTPPC